MISEKIKGQTPTKKACLIPIINAKPASPTTKVGTVEIRPSKNKEVIVLQFQFL